ncbi:hypothetical protein LTR78_007063 [Recurvomyces mirabilis]|uniref:Uncharacterized protein n=1 Tax=Recurvomyces mirabilis TaxID=574656 RepID=A0AAE0WJP2_9PEZI|nr:hypothetical protein LTR78_007063 [Recurvomyces mirabilis]KAK5150965.1 hypothetical protein LTS14_009769 [Recurvomyces mirabilis]
MAIQGDVQADQSRAQNYCAPYQAKGCTTGVSTNGIASEQNFHPKAHFMIRNSAVGPSTGPGSGDGVVEFHFRTAFIDNDQAFATRVDFYKQGKTKKNPTTTSVLYAQYDPSAELAPPILVSHSFHSNDCLEISTRHLTDHEVAIHGSRNTHDLAKKLDLGVVVHELIEVPMQNATQMVSRQVSCVDDPDTSDPDDDDATSTDDSSPTVVFATIACFATAVKTIIGYS